MSSRQLQSPLYHSVSKPSSRPPPLWQIAAGLDPAAGRPTEEPREPSTSALLAGWICVGLGLLTAWFFPLAHVFFAIALVLSVVALATHQVRGGLGLLAGSLAGMGICAVLFVAGAAMLVAGAFHSAAKPRPEREAATPQPNAQARHGPVAVEGIIGGNPMVDRNVRPLALDEVIAMLGAGKREDQIIAATAGRPLLDRIDPSAVTSLRVYGANDRLINDLRTRPVSGYSRLATANLPPPAATPAPPMTQAAATSAAWPTPVDYQARDRQIETLKSQIDVLDEEVRCIRANPRDYRWRWRYDTTRFGNNEQAARDAYLKGLDRQRDDLRRQKWALEGR